MPKNLDEILADLGDCRRCPLSETRTTIVFGVGNPQAEVMFIGEAPGRQEDLGAEPFIGAAGQYLNELLSLAGLTRSEIYIANVLKCRPPDNRDPGATEIEVCSPFLRDQVRAIAPDIIVTLGNFATRFILRTDRGITSMRGQIQITGPFTVLPVFHPAAAIYDRQKQTIMEKDFRLLGRLVQTRRAERLARADSTPTITLDTDSPTITQDTDTPTITQDTDSPTITQDTDSPAETRAFARRLAAYLKPDDVLILSGDLGAGKTEFTKGIAEGLGVSGPVNSPTFNLLLVHPVPEQQDGAVADSRVSTTRAHSLYHFDLYRLDEAQELEDLDYFGLLEDGAVSVIEWGNRFSEAMPKDYLLILIEASAEQQRRLTISAHGQQSRQLISEWQSHEL